MTSALNSIAPNPPPPEDIDSDQWAEAVRVVRLFVSTVVPMRPGWEAERADYEASRSTIDEALFTMAHAAVLNWDDRKSELRAAQTERLGIGDWRALARSAQTAVSHRRRQFSVGQGGFHVGSVQAVATWPPSQSIEWSDKRALLYAYDCGSEPKKHVDAQVGTFITEASRRALDFLFLSHFDRDHLCGIPSLLDAKAGVVARTIVLPYVDDVERLIALGRGESRGQEIDDFFIEMVIDPVASLGRYRPDRIIFVLGRDGHPPEEVSPAEVPQSPEGGLFWSARDRTGERPTQGWKLDETGAFAVRDVSFQVEVGDAAWRLIPYVRRADSTPLAAFEIAMEVLLGLSRGSLAEHLADPAKRRTLVTTERTKVARAYKYAFKDKNLTSLCLYSGPWCPEKAGAIQISPVLQPAPLARVAWIGTGDADLRTPSSIDGFKNHYGDVLNYVSTFLLPHHGSIHNADPVRLPSSADSWVAAADPIHLWEHPAPLLEEAVEARGAAFHKVTSNPAKAFDERVIVTWRRAEN